MHPRARELHNTLGMRPHPEGGHYVELFRSSQRIQVLDRKVERSALTAIYFLLAAGEFSRWHRVVSDEIWHYHEGDTIELLLFDDRGLRRVQLGPVAGEARPTVVKATRPGTTLIWSGSVRTLPTVATAGLPSERAIDSTA